MIIIMMAVMVVVMIFVMVMVVIMIIVVPIIVTIAMMVVMMIIVVLVIVMIAMMVVVMIIMIVGQEPMGLFFRSQGGPGILRQLTELGDLLLLLDSPWIRPGLNRLKDALAQPMNREPLLLGKIRVGGILGSKRN